MTAAGLSHARQVALDVGHKDRDAARAKALSDTLQGHGLTRACRTGNNTVAVGHVREQEELALAVFCYKYWFCHTVGTQAASLRLS